MTQRKPRRDKGSIHITERDQQCLEWVADQYAVRIDQLQPLLSRWPGGKLREGHNQLAETTVRDQVDRWRQAGWVEYDRILAKGPGWVWITRKGLQMIDLDEFYTARVPASTRLTHIYAVNQLRLFIELQLTSWKSEREYRAELEPAKKGKSQGPIPDAVIESPKVGKVAIEVELSPKKPDDLYKKLQALIYFDNRSYESVFPAIWFYVPNERMKVLIERAREKLPEKERRRVAVGLQPGLLP